MSLDFATLSPHELRIYAAGYLDATGEQESVDRAALRAAITENTHLGAHLRQETQAADRRYQAAALAPEIHRSVAGAITGATARAAREHDRRNPPFPLSRLPAVRRRSRLHGRLTGQSKTRREWPPEGALLGPFRQGLGVGEREARAN